MAGVEDLLVEQEGPPISYKLQVTSCKLQVTSYKLQVVGEEGPPRSGEVAEEEGELEEGDLRP